MSDPLESLRLSVDASVMGLPLQKSWRGDESFSGCCIVDNTPFVAKMLPLVSTCLLRIGSLDKKLPCKQCSLSWHIAKLEHLFIKRIPDQRGFFQVEKGTSCWKEGTFSSYLYALKGEENFSCTLKGRYELNWQLTT